MPEELTVNNLMLLLKELRIVQREHEYQQVNFVQSWEQSENVKRKFELESFIDNLISIHNPQPNK